MLNIQGFGRPAPIPTVGAVYDCTISHAARSQSAHPHRPYMLNIEGFGRPAPIPTVGAVYDCTISHAARSQSVHPHRPYMLNIEGFGRPAPIPTVGAVYDCTIRTKLILFVSAHGAVYDRYSKTIWAVVISRRVGGCSLLLMQ